MLSRLKCDELTDLDIETLATIIAGRGEFRVVMGVFPSGFRLEDALKKYQSKESDTILLVNDKVKDELDLQNLIKLKTIVPDQDKARGFVLCSYIDLPEWIDSVFTAQDLNKTYDSL